MADHAVGHRQSKRRCLPCGRSGRVRAPCCLRVLRRDRLVESGRGRRVCVEQHERPVTCSGQEARVHQLVHQRLALLPGEAPETLCLSRRQPQPGHLQVFALNSTQQVLESRGQQSAPPIFLGRVGSFGGTDGTATAMPRASTAFSRVPHPTPEQTCLVMRQRWRTWRRVSRHW